MSVRIVNRKARYLYQIMETWEVGIALSGQEVKSIKTGHMDLKGAYVRVRTTVAEGKGRLRYVAELVNAFIPPYVKAGPQLNYEPRRTRKLLFRRVELVKLLGQLNTKGLTLVPLIVYTRNRLVKVQVGLARGKSKVDKRQDIKKREVDREIRRTTLKRASNRLGGIS